jgi:hypothetical protein
MAFTIPNHADAFSAFQAEPDSVDFDILAAGYSGSGVISGCAVTAQGTPDMTVAVAAGIISVAGVRVAVTGTNSTIGTADGTNPRCDIITINNSGTVATTAGTAAAVPELPSIPSNSIVIALVFIPSSDTAIATNQIVDKRVLLSASGGVLDDIIMGIGSDSDIAILNRSTSLSADAEVTNIIEGTSDHLGVAANSLIVSNITNDGDIMFVVSDAGNSKGLLKLDGANGRVVIHGGDLLMSGAQKIYFYDIGGEYMSSDGSTLAITGATTISSTLGVTSAITATGGFTSAAASTITIDADAEFIALKLTNQSDAADTTGFVTLAFDLEDTGGTAVDAGKISVKKEASFTATASTQDSKMEFQLSENGTLAEKMTLSSAGALSIDGALSIGGSEVLSGSALDSAVKINNANWSGTDLAVLNGGTGASSLTNLITLGTHTTGNYAATVANATNGGITVSNSGSESAAITVALNFTDLTAATVNVAADSIPFLDADGTASRIESIADLASAMAGDNVTASSGQLSVSGSATVWQHLL